MVTPGGEVAFVSRMIKESEKLREKVQWYTSMLGMLSSVETLIEKLKNAGITNYAVTEFVQGSKTRRWAIAWSWMDYRPTTVSPFFTSVLFRYMSLTQRAIASRKEPQEHPKTPPPLHA